MRLSAAPARRSRAACTTALLTSSVARDAAPPPRISTWKIKILLVHWPRFEGGVRSGCYYDGEIRRVCCSNTQLNTLNRCIFELVATLSRAMHVYIEHSVCTANNNNKSRNYAQHFLSNYNHIQLDFVKRQCVPNFSYLLRSIVHTKQNFNRRYVALKFCS